MTNNKSGASSQNSGAGQNKDSSGKDFVAQAKDFGKDLQGQASELTQSATEAVKTQAGQLKDQAKDVASNATDRLRETVTEQKAAGADYVGNVASIIRRTAREFDADLPQAGQYIRKAAAQLENVSGAMRNNDMSQIVGNVQDFARKQPTAFFGAAMLLGFAAVRFLKSAPSNPQSGTTRMGSSSSTSGASAAGM
jgi:gas vesicle protein